MIYVINDELHNITLILAFMDSLVKWTGWKYQNWFIGHILDNCPINLIWPGGWEGVGPPPSSLIKEKNTFSLNGYNSGTKWLRYLNWVKLGHILGELNLRPFFEQITPSSNSGESLGVDMPPSGWKKVQKVPGFRGLNISSWVNWGWKKVPPP